MVLRERVTPYIPECSSHNFADFEQEWYARGQYFNLTDARTYVYDEVLPSVVPGIVVGTLALLGFIIFLMWMFVGCCISCCRCMRCCKCCPPTPKAAANPEAKEQFISGGGMSQLPATYPGPGLESAGRKRKCVTKRNVFWAFFMALALTVVGISIWGLVETLRQTDTTVSDFWDLVDVAQSKVEGSIQALQVVQSQTQNLTEASTVLSDNQAGVASALESAPGITPAMAQQISTKLTEVPRLLAKAPEGVGVGIAFLTDSVNTTIADMRDKFEPPTMALEETWRFIPIAVLFGCLILVTLATALAVYYMTWMKTAAFLVALLWLIIALLMYLGTGLLNGVYVVSDDACLYVESFAVAFAANKAPDNKWGDLAVFLVKYYINSTDLSELGVPLPSTNVTSYVEALPESAQQPLQDVTALLKEIGEGAQNLFNLATSPVVQASLEQKAPGLSNAMTVAGIAVGALGAAVGNLTELANRNATLPLYHDVKEYICCGLSDSAYDMWVAWTVAGCLGFVLALLASGRIMRWAVQQRKKRKADRASMPGGAALWQQPPPMVAPADSKPSDMYEPPPAQAVDEPKPGWGAPPGAYAVA